MYREKNTYTGHTQIHTQIYIQRHIHTPHTLTQTHTHIETYIHRHTNTTHTHTNAHGSRKKTWEKEWAGERRRVIREDN